MLFGSEDVQERSRMYITQALKRSIQLHGDDIATICQGRKRTWSETGDRVAKFAGALRRLGVSGGERVAMLSLNSDLYFEYFFAVPWAGGVFVPINIRLAPPEVAFWLNDSGSEILLIDDRFLPILEALKGQLKAVREIIYAGDGDAPEGMASIEDLIADTDPVADAMRGNDDLAGLFYTGGTTGRSKGVMLSHRNLVFNNMNSIHSFNYHQGMRWLHVCPMFHIAGGIAIFGVTQVAGTHVIIPGYAPELALETIQNEKVTDTLFVPTMVNMMVNYPEVAKFDLSSLKVMTYGASPMPEAVVRRAMEILPECGFYHAYGQTETAPLVTMTPPECHVFEGPNAGLYRAAGRPVVGVEVRIVDEDDNEVPRGEVGEICVRGPNVMLGYWEQPELTAQALRGGWMHSGDGGYMDERGFIFIVDRMKDMVISGGENIYSAEVEDALYQHPAVVECAVIGIPDERWGEAVHAIVRLQEGKAASAEELIAHCHTLIANYKCPRGIEFVTDPLPLSGAGKILKTELRKPYWEGKQKQVN